MLRTKTGIQGLDKALNGGFPEGNIVLVSGGAGTGKSTLCLQFIINGAKLFGEKGLYISTEQNEEELQKQASSFGWDISELQKKGLLKITYFDIGSGENFLKRVDEMVKSFQPKRIVIDSMTTLTDALMISGIGEKEPFSLVQIAETVSPIPRTDQIISKTILYSLIKEIKKFRLTTLLTSELYEEFTRLSADGVSEFIADGVIILHYIGAGAATFRTLRVRKMRYTDHEKSSLTCDMTPKGIEIKQQEFNL
ncbi:MAG: ATPase domain-containing protein [Candidatus ainarchaeum sp.]|nr:ATPase domain-containing protein [Candidatus ainarchaeum sp.]